MAINVIVQYNGGFLPDILLLTQAPTFVWFDGTIIVCYNYALQQYLMLTVLLVLFPPTFVWFDGTVIVCYNYALQQYLMSTALLVLSTCPLHTNSGCGKERRILIGPW